jgi:hypothetical protein
MNEIDPGAQASRHASASKGGTGFAPMAPIASAATASLGAPDGNETLAWLAGNRMPDRRTGLQAPAGSDTRTDKVLSSPRPSDPIQAAAQRASVLADLHSHAPRDPRVQSVFESDPILVEDPANGNLVTKLMLAARLEVFDAVLTMLERPALPRGVRTRTALTLKGAYRLLSDDAQVEWALSEVRLEETKAFLDTRAQSDLDALRSQVAATLEKHDIWAATRAFSMAAHLSVGQSKGSAALADLLEPRESD